MKKSNFRMPTIGNKVMLSALALALCVATSCKKESSSTVDEPIAESSKSEASISSFTPSGVSVAAATAYSTSTGSTTIGSIGDNENVLILGSASGRTQITYNTGGADKTGWVVSSSVKSSTFQWPVEAVNKTQDFNAYSSSRNGYHLAIDMTSALGETTLRATAKGVIKYAGYSNGNGNHIIIDHTRGDGTHIYSLQSHFASFASGISTGASVVKNQSLGTMGCTGSCTGTHVHFCFMKSYYSSDPYGYTSSGGTTISRTSDKIVMDYTTLYDPEWIVANSGSNP